jgi:diguanylate cyclase (GGDEF)-like protein
MVGAGTIYTLAFADGDRLGMGLVIALAGCLGIAVLRVISWERVIASERLEAALLCWSLLMVAAVAGVSALDGGATSPLALALLLPAIFASLAYSLRRVVLIAATAEVAFLALTLIGSPGAGFVLIFCATLAGAAVMAVWQARFHQAWRRQLARSSRTDPLTGLLNRRGLAQASDLAFADLWRHRRAVTLLLIDLDLFKAYNDIHGHQAGDELLRWAATEVTEAVGPEAAVARLGGDEFAVLLPGLDREGAEPVVNRVHAALDPRAAHCLGRATAPGDGVTFDELYRAGDSDLYQCKVLRPKEIAEDPSHIAYEHRRRQHPFSADAILAGITEAFLVLDDDWRFAYVNQAAARLLDHSPAELLGHSIWEVFPEATGTKFERAYRQVVATGRCERFSAYYAPLETTFSVKASSVPGGISVYFHEVGGEDEEAQQLASGQVAGRPLAGTRVAE